ncbi:MAG TPA: GspE/PulE family protein [Thermodesulfobacteriota bacterium]|nr:GspE/PulE family protein [Thermodesulfobacteriota bacterium]HNU72622.1 GspE/PulE family protein [Thermodesulfobacteriota bacterium]
MAASSAKTKEEIEKLRQIVEYNESLKAISKEIHAAENIDQILLDLKDKVRALFDVERVTVYAVDHAKKEIYSKMKEGEEVTEIRMPVNRKSIAGFCATTGKILMIENAYDSEELARISPEIEFDKSWDQKTGFNTHDVLVAPLIYNKYLMGVIQLLNKRNGGSFTADDRQSVSEIAEVLGLAFFNQIKRVKKKPSKFDYLISNSIVSQKELDEGTLEARLKKSDVITILMTRYGVSKEDIGKSLESFYNVKFQPYDPSIHVDHRVSRLLRPEFLKKSLWMPLREDGKNLVVLIDDPHDIQKKDAIEQWVKFNWTKAKEIAYRVSLPDDINRFIDSATSSNKVDVISGAGAVSKPKGKSASEMKIQDILGGLEDLENVDLDLPAEVDDEMAETDSKIVQLANKVIIDAYNQGISDIHIEPYLGKKDTEIRFRKDGGCFKYLEIPPSHTSALISRYKIMARLKIEEKRLPQDGKIKLRYQGRDIELRVATVPTAGGNEDIVMRILTAGEPLPLEKMQFLERNIQVLKKIAERPYGLILCVGPTGSGKTTTLHSILGYINTEDRKIWTAEDPVEISQYRLRQVQINPNIKTQDGHRYTFATAMRAFLRADPDVIMVGEMRDLETASIGIEASLTGHLVFSTLHTNSAPETITRLIDIGLDPFNFADALLGILAQRLVRTICPRCKQPYHPDKEEFDKLVQEYGPESFDKLGIGYDDAFMLHRGAGCEACNKTGLSGRIAVHELLEGTDSIKELMVHKAPVEEIRKKAIQEGMTTLLQDGILKVLKGFTTLEQVRRVCMR